MMALPIFLCECLKNADSKETCIAPVNKPPNVKAIDIDNTLSEKALKAKEAACPITPALPKFLVPILSDIFPLT